MLLVILFSLFVYVSSLLLFFFVSQTGRAALLLGSIQRGCDDSWMRVLMEREYFDRYLFNLDLVFLVVGEILSNLVLEVMLYCFDVPSLPLFNC